MLSVGLNCFVLIPNEKNERLLVPGRVTELSNGGAMARFEEPVALQPGNEGTIFFEMRGKFFQQPIKVVTTQAEPAATSPQGVTPAAACLLGFATCGQPILSDGRGSFRVSIAAAQLMARVNKQANCQVVDMSPEGCGIICRKALVVGTTVNVEFTCEGVTISGPMKVQTQKTLPSGNLRFGLYAVEKNSATRRGLEKLSMVMQRLQLKRLAGAA